MITVTNTLPVYEINDKPTNDISRPKITVSSPWGAYANNGRVEICLLDGTKIVVEARDLLAAIKNATNTR